MTRSPGSCRTLLFLAVVWACAALAHAQQSADASLPEAPGAQSGAAQAASSSATISGTIMDEDGDAIAGAKLSLSGAALSTPHQMAADQEGYFIFMALPPGEYSLSVLAPGFRVVAARYTVAANQDLVVPNIVMMASVDQDVEVSASQHDVAEAEIRLEEHQRIAGIIPNFYVTYDFHAAPLSAGQKYRLAFHEIIDPYNFIVSGVIAGAEQATNAFPGYNQGAAGFGKRYGASLADGTVGTLLGGAFFPALLHQDPRYFYKGDGTILQRFWYALATAVICKGDNGKWQFNYSAVLGDVASGSISNLYYPASNKNGWDVTIENGLLNAAEDGLSNVLQEFLFKPISTGTNRPPKKQP